MYKLLLCLRYLRTRYIALASIISVMLGVATMIVVNSVMSGFATEMQNRIHGILADVVLDTRDFSGVFDDRKHKEVILDAVGDSVEAMTTTVAVPAMLSFRRGDNWINRQVQLIGVDEETVGRVSDFAKYLQHPANRLKPSFELREGGYDTRGAEAGPDTPERPDMKHAGWEYRRRMAQARAIDQRLFGPGAPRGAAPGLEGGPSPEPAPHDPFAARAQAEAARFDPAREQHPGVVLGIILATYRLPGSPEDQFLLLPGDDVTLTFPNAPAGEPPKILSHAFTVVDFYESKMSEYDSSFVFVPLSVLQELRGMKDPSSGLAKFNSIQIKLKPGANGDEIRDRLRAAFDPRFYVIQTWRDRQGPLLAAVHMETAILNVLLFLIIAVSGFGILAIFFMIVVEKTRDIGILKSLGASALGVMGIFLAYGLSLGLVGSGVGMILGLEFSWHINEVADFLGKITGEPVFDPSIYYFYRIPAIVDPWTVASIVLGAVGIAVLASVLPAIRAAMLHPVESLRYE
ncbi:MAG: ABC transporter permease [Thermoguttaceae bacterium]|jgi:lipoprotein-releasing system permease protein|nr:ABC transporter permease [Thermoguttaceae bacterium]